MTSFLILQSSGGNSWFGSLVATIIGNLKISISNVHVRYEDTLRYVGNLFLFSIVFRFSDILMRIFLFNISCSNQGHPFCCGLTLSKLAALTTDEEGNETFDTSGALDKLRKVVLV